MDRHNIFGRHLELHKAIKFLCDESENRRILNINGIYGVGCTEIAKFAIMYVIARQFFKDGAFYVDLEKKFSSGGL